MIKNKKVYLAERVLEGKENDKYVKSWPSTTKEFTI